MTDIVRKEAMIQMRREGKTLQEIGDRFEISRERVRQLLQGTDVEGFMATHGNHKIAIQRYQKVEQLWNEGITMNEIACQMGVSLRSITTVIYKMRKQGWNLPYRRTDLSDG